MKILSFFIKTFLNILKKKTAFFNCNHISQYYSFTVFFIK